MKSGNIQKWKTPRRRERMGCGKQGLKVGCMAKETFSGNLYEMSQLLTELVPAVTMSFDEGHTQATISPLLCIMASQTKTALSLS
jgi:hypothetical protein